MCVMGDGEKQGWMFAAFATAALAMAVGLGVQIIRGGVSIDDKFDVVGATVALVALAVSFVAARQSSRAFHWQETDLEILTVRLVPVVLASARDARNRLLGDNDKAIDVPFVLLPAPAHNAEGARESGELETVEGYYRDLKPRRLVITGEPGAGKTVLALQLIVRLLKERAPSDPVPVRLSLASWEFDENLEDCNETVPDVEEWITKHLVDTYPLSVASARTLVKARRVLPVLDGLDEMDVDTEPGYESRAGRAVRALNKYQDADGKAALILTCRTQTYVALQNLRRVWTQDAARVEIRPVDAARAGNFLRSWAAEPSRWESVIDTLEQSPNSPLTESLSTPWRLTLASIVHEPRNAATGEYERDPQELLASELNTSEKVREHLLELLVPALTTLNKPQHGTPYTPEQVCTWLRTLAAYLNHNAATGRTLGGRLLSGTDIVLHQLWPLAGTRFPRAVHTGLIVAVWLVSATAMLLQAPIGSPRIVEVTYILLLLAVTAAFIAAMRSAWREVWLEPVRADLLRLRTATNRRFAIIFFLLGFAAVLVFSLVAGLAFGLMAGAGPMAGLASGLNYGLVPALAMGFGLGFLVGSVRPVTLNSVDPRGIVWNSFLSSLPFALVVGLVAGFQAGSANGVATGLAVGLSFGAPGLRYVAMLLCTRLSNRHWLPWRLGRFLHWCYRAGLLRIAGNGYQFRHRELQVYLARSENL